jgi:hypothetical protein
MDPRIRFETKEESNARREAAFRDLPPAERFAWFLRTFDGRIPPTPAAPSRNFIIRKVHGALR